MNTTPRKFINRIHVSQRIQRLVHPAGGAQSPSEQAIRSIDDFRSTPRW